MKRLILCLVCIIGLAPSALAQQWSKYIPEKQRKSIFKKSIKTGGLGLAMTGQTVAAIWMTDQTARALVSEAIDRERLTPDAADLKFKALRPDNGYCFLFNSLRFAIGVLGAATAKTVANPLKSNETFLQRSEDQKKFSRGQVDDREFDIALGGVFSGPGTIVTYRVVFDKTDSEGQALVRDLKDKIGVQFNLSGKKVVFEYKLKDLVSALEEL